MATGIFDGLRAPKTMTLEFDEATDRILEDLRRALGMNSRAEVLRKAVALLQVAVEAQQDGGGIATIDKTRNIRQTIKLV
jgi:hypothetical protein